MNAVRYCGFLNEPTGYGEAARRHIDALCRAGERVSAESIRLTAGGWEPDPVDVHRHPRLAALHRERDEELEPTLIAHTPPPSWRGLAGLAAQTIGVAAWETESLPPRWVDELAVVDQIWVPSTFCRDVFASSTSRPVRVVPHPVAPMPDAPRFFPGIPDDVFLFASIAEWSDRKNPDGLLTAFCRAFAGRRDVALLLKIGFRVTGGRRRDALARMRKITSGLRLPRPPPVFIVSEDLNPRSIEHLYARADAYVSLHRAEGFGLCLAEAMAAGVPVVATNYSGNLEFMDASTAWLVGYRMVAVEQKLSPTWFHGRMHWAEPDLGEAIEAMRGVVTHEGRARRMARAARERVARDLCPQRIGETMRAGLNGTA